MSIKMSLDAEGAAPGKVFRARTKKWTEQQIKATQAAARRAASEIETAGRADIAAGGNFSSDRWQSGFRALLSYQSRTTIVIRVTHAVFYWRVFEFGKRIFGKPLLWIPLSFGNAKGRARDYGKPLFRVNRKVGNPLLFDDTGPQYVGLESVKIPKKWHLRRVVSDVRKKLPQYYREAMKSDG